MNDKSYLLGRKKLRWDPNLEIDFKDVSLLCKFVTDFGKIIPRRTTGLSASKQRELTLAIKRARHLGLMNPEAKETEILK